MITPLNSLISGQTSLEQLTCLRQHNQEKQIEKSNHSLLASGPGLLVSGRESHIYKGEPTDA